MQDAVASIAGIAKSAGKHAGIFATDMTMVPRYVEMGYRFIALGAEAGIIAAGQKAILAAAGA